MSDDNITVSVPSYDKRALALAGEFFTKLAGDENDQRYPAQDAYDQGFRDGNAEERNWPDTAGHIDEALPADQDEAGVSVEPPAPQADDQDEQTTDLDANGLPWDARIHASTKSRNADGSWRNKRGVDKAVVEQIEQELRDLMAIPVQDDTLHHGSSDADRLTREAQRAAPPPPPATDKQPDLPPDYLPQPPANDTPADFPSFLRAVSKMMTEGTTSQEQVNNVLAKHGIAKMPLVAARADLIPQLWVDIVADSEGGV